MAPPKTKTSSKDSHKGVKRKAASFEDDEALHRSIGVTPGDAFVWGEGDCGQLGVGPDLTGRYRPVPIPKLEGIPLFQVACGGMHTCAVTAKREVYTWGVNDEGALGRESDDDGTTEPGLVEGISKVLQISAGDSHTLALTASRDVWAWGCYREDGPYGFQPGTKIQALPTLVLPVNDKDPAVKVTSGGDHSVVLTVCGKVWTWGCGAQGQLGRVGARVSMRSKMDTYLTPAVMKMPRGSGKPVDVFAGSYSTFILTDTDKVYCCGLNNYGQLGLPPSGIVYAPTLVPALCGKGVVKIASGQHHTLALTGGPSAEIISFGSITYGRLGREVTEVKEEGQETERFSAPAVVSANIEGEPVDIATGIGTSAAICGEDAYLWGCNVSYQLAKGDEDEDEPAPLKIKETKKFNNRKALQIELGGQHAILLSTVKA